MWEARGECRRFLRPTLRGGEQGGSTYLSQGNPGLKDCSAPCGRRGSLNWRLWRVGNSRPGVESAFLTLPASSRVCSLSSHRFSTSRQTLTWIPDSFFSR